ncbi:hypothetical protein O181_022655 [Austropuccinia psidii MF-1]|uniref:Uncharacterized protein n=1 Tax=Austropuccinia psidii MF-1 TaxID=1389203 RepID=A0A9Q3CHT8_9BASI|nr:hypothetical protein [Austropuccinia psidii MF-1]
MTTKLYGIYSYYNSSGDPFQGGRAVSENSIGNEEFCVRMLFPFVGRSLSFNPYRRRIVIGSLSGMVVPNMSSSMFLIHLQCLAAITSAMNSALQLDAQHTMTHYSHSIELGIRQYAWPTDSQNRKFQVLCPSRCHKAAFSWKRCLSHIAAVPCAVEDGINKLLLAELISVGCCEYVHTNNGTDAVSPLQYAQLT